MTLLEHEQRWVRAGLYLTPFVVLSGLITFAWPALAPYWVQALFLAHAAFGILLTPIALAYVVLHFYRTFGNRLFSVFASGLLGGGLLAVCVGSGLWLVVFGQTETTRWVLTLHIATSIALVLSIGGHCLAHLAAEKRKRKPRQVPMPSVAATSWYRVGVGTVVVVAVTVGLWAYASIFARDDLRQAAPASYTKTYGENPMGPSETTIAGGGVIAKRGLDQAERCKQCHADVVKQWRSSVHGKAALDPAYERNALLLEQGKGIEALRYCEGCHAPVALLSGSLKPGGTHGGMDKTPSNQAGVNCMTCHSVSKVRHTRGVGSYEYKQPDPYMLTYVDEPWASYLNRWLIRMRPELHRRGKATDRIQSPAFCATCHAQYMDERMNDWGWVKMQDQYQSWLDGPYSGRDSQGFAADEVRKCRDCHMQEVSAQDPSSGHAGKVSNHWFPAANTFVPSVTGDQKHLRRVREFLRSDKMRVTVDLEENPRLLKGKKYVSLPARKSRERPDTYFLDQKIAGTVSVANINVGHKFPAGTNDINEAWVSLRVKDANGRRIFSRGHIDDAGELVKPMTVYTSVKVDRHGDEVWKHDLFRMVGERYTNVVKPGEVDTLRFEFDVPDWAVGPLVVRARLNYRKFKKRYGAWVMRDADYTAPKTVMARDSVEVNVVQKPGAEEPAQQE